MREVDIDVEGDIVERQELLNATETLVLEGQGDGWLVSALVTWNRGLDPRPPEGDITLTDDRGSELFAAVTSVRADESPLDDAMLTLRVMYAVEGGTGEFASAEGEAEATIELAAARFRGRWRLRLR